jgi:hypothetical protein
MHIVNLIYGASDKYFHRIHAGDMLHFLLEFRSGGGGGGSIFQGPERGSFTDMEHFFHLGKVQKRSG